jgi:hypothetical protein
MDIVAMALVAFRDHLRQKHMLGKGTSGHTRDHGDVASMEAEVKDCGLSLVVAGLVPPTGHLTTLCRKRCQGQILLHHRT